jgi:hypothetical protein
MKAVRKPAETPDQTAAGPASPAVLPGQAANSGPPGSPVHALRNRIEEAFRPPSELATLRITTMVLVLAISTWLAVLFLLTTG